MRYLILANNSGGLYHFRKELMERMIQDGHEVYAVTPFDEFIEELREIGVKLIEQEMNRRGKNPLQELNLMWDYWNIIKKVVPDKIITYTIKPGIYGGFLAKWSKIPYVANITGLGTGFQSCGPLRSIIVWLWKRALRSADSVFLKIKRMLKYS